MEESHIFLIFGYGSCLWEKGGDKSRLDFGKLKGKLRFP
jgi:hypothetical protein